MAHIIDESSCKMRCCNKCDMYRKELQRYKYLEEKGLLVKIPCEMKLGQKWFYIGFDKPIEFEIVDFGWWNTDGLCAYGFGEFPNMSKMFFPFSYFGKYVFKTLSEAEQALKEM